MTRTALITGGGGGIGAAVVEVLRREQIACTITGRKPNRSQDLDPEIGYIQLDFLDPTTIDPAFAAIDALAPDIVVNNAGINNKAAIGDVTTEQLHDILEVNLAGPYRVVQRCLPHMVTSGWGRVVNLSSIWSVAGNPGNTAYCASKFGVDGLTTSLAAEVARKGVLVNAVAPGYTLTEVMQTKYTKEALDQTCSQIPMQRMAQPSEIAEVIGFLVSERNTYLTGQNILVDGGLSRTTHPWREW